MVQIGVMRRRRARSQNWLYQPGPEPMNLLTKIIALLCLLVSLPIECVLLSMESLFYYFVALTTIFIQEDQLKLGQNWRFRVRSRLVERYTTPDYNRRTRGARRRRMNTARFTHGASTGREWGSNTPPPS